MTREEQIDWLCRLRADLNNGVIFTPWNKEFSEAINDVLEQEPTTKNDLGVDGTINGLDDFIEFGKKAFGVELTIKKSDNPDTYEKLFGTTKNDLGVDCISRQYLKNKMIQLGWKHPDITITEFVEDLPSVTPQEPQTFKWCTDCREYEQEKHCCHRWSKVIRNTVEELKQEYIEREVLDKIKGQMKDYLRGVEITLEVLVENDPLRPKMEGAKDTLEECLELINMAERSGEE